MYEIEGTAVQIMYEIIMPAEGFNATLFAYGQTGTGKSHTVMGGVGGNLPVDRRCYTFS